MDDIDSIALAAPIAVLVALLGWIAVFAATIVISAKGQQARQQR